MDSIAWNIGNTVCQLSDTIGVRGWFGDACSQSQQFGYILIIAFIVAAALVWLFKPSQS